METNKKQAIYKIIMIIVLTATVTFILSTVFIYKNLEGNGNTKYIMVSDENSKLQAELSTIQELIKKYYLGEFDEEKAIEGAIKGYVDGVNDEYTEYYTKEEWEDFAVETMGNYVGIGVYITSDTDNQIRIITPIEDSPAEEAGLLSGDIIYKINDVEYKGEQLEEASNAIKGNENTEVKLEIKRDDEILTFNVKRKTVKINHIKSEMLDNNIGYLQLITFDEGCAEEFEEKYKELEKQGMEALIIDVRNNTGGIVEETIDILSYLTPKDTVLIKTVDKNKNEEVYKSTGNKIVDVPVVVLVNENSASATEILASALQTNNLAEIVGVKTYGKGVIQDVLGLQDGGAIKITTKEYYTANNERINNTGVTPDEVVELPEEYKNIYDVPREEDTQLEKAIEILK